MSAAHRTRLVRNACASILNVTPCSCGEIFSMKVRIIIRPMENGRIAERKCAWGRKIPRRIAAGMIIARLFPIRLTKLVKTNGLFFYIWRMLGSRYTNYVLSEIFEEPATKSIYTLVLPGYLPILLEV